MNTRRQFLLECSKLAAVTVAVAPSVMLAAPGRSDPMALANFRRSLQSVFLAQMDPTTNVELELIRVRLSSLASLGKHPLKAPDRHNERFSLLFRGPLNGVLDQNTYTFEHKNMGTFPMFIVPMKSQDKQYQYYEAVFNRLNKGVKV
ncbi:MAG: hypothetical protein JWM68_1850 [Verrucomicrobiales bacterium]|nr:hypothetical protein [Verrucomicrobiales bacterium]